MVNKLLVYLLLISFIGVSTASTEDLTSYTSVDSSGIFTINSTTVNTTLDMATHSAYIYKTISGLTDFKITGETLRYSNTGNQYGGYTVIIIGDCIGDVHSANWCGNGLGIYANSNPLSFQAIKFMSGVGTTSAGIPFSNDIQYYYTIERWTANATLQIRVYTDAAHTSEISGSPKQLTSIDVTSFTKLTILDNDIGYNYEHRAYVEDVDLNLVTPTPTPTPIGIIRNLNLTNISTACTIINNQFVGTCTFIYGSDTLIWNTTIIAICIIFIVIYIIYKEMVR